MLWRKTFWLSKYDFCRLFHTERSWHAFSAIIVVSGRHDLPFDARAFSLTSFEMQCSSSPLNKGFRLFSFLLSASWIQIIISDFVLVRECDGFLRCFVTRDNYCLPGFAFLMIITKFRFLVTVFSKAQQMNIHKNADITIHNTFMRFKKVACHFEINRNLKTLINSGTFWLVFMLNHVLFRNGHLS